MPDRRNIAHGKVAPSLPGIADATRRAINRLENLNFQK
jgi:hypothetical protein